MLAFFHLHEVGSHIVDIHQHVVLEILEAGGRTEGGVFPTLGDDDAGVEHVAAIVGLTVGDSGLSFAVPESVGERVLADVLIVEDIVDAEAVTLLID